MHTYVYMVYVPTYISFPFSSFLSFLLSFLLCLFLSVSIIPFFLSAMPSFLPFFHDTRACIMHECFGRKDGEEEEEGRKGEH